MMTSAAWSIPSESAASRVWRSGDLEIDPARWLARIGDAVAQLTYKELGLLKILMSAGGAPVTRTELWNASSATIPNSSRSLDAHVWSLRKKLERDPSHPAHLITIPGFGYRLV